MYYFVIARFDDEASVFASYFFEAAVYCGLYCTLESVSGNILILCQLFATLVLQEKPQTFTCRQFLFDCRRCTEVFRRLGCYCRG